MELLLGGVSLWSASDSDSIISTALGGNFLRVVLLTIGLVDESSAVRQMLILQSLSSSPSSLTSSTISGISLLFIGGDSYVHKVVAVSPLVL